MAALPDGNEGLIFEAEYALVAHLRKFIYNVENHLLRFGFAE